MRGAGTQVVLLIDDQPFIGAAVRELLDSEPSIDLQCCHEPLDARRVAGELRPDVILLDLVMPGIDGRALLTALRADSATASTPVIVMSANDDAQTRRGVLEQGAAGFLVKLPTRAELIACLHGLATGASAGDAPRAGAPSDAGSADHGTLDASVLDAYRQGIPEGAGDIVPTVVGLFLEEAARLLQTLGDAVRSADMPAMKAAAHALRGTAATVGAKRLAALSTQLEDHAGRGSSRAVASVLFKELTSEMIELRRALEARRAESDGR